MKLKLTDSLRKKIRKTLTELILDAFDGSIDFPDQFVSALRTLADEVEQQNTRSGDMRGLMSELPEGLH